MNAQLQYVKKVCEESDALYLWEVVMEQGKHLPFQVGCFNGSLQVCYVNCLCAFVADRVLGSE